MIFLLGSLGLSGDGHGGCWPVLRTEEGITIAGGGVPAVLHRDGNISGTFSLLTAFIFLVFPLHRYSLRLSLSLTWGRSWGCDLFCEC